MPYRRTLADQLRAAAIEEPAREAYVHDGRRVTYGWLDRAADGFAATLLDQGVRPGDRVCLMLPSSVDFATCYAGAARASAITTAVNLRLGAAEQSSIVARTEPAVTVIGDDGNVPRGVDPGQVFRVSDLEDAFAQDPVAALHSPSPDDPVCIVWTSGTTGAPKGAVFSHAALDAIGRNVRDKPIRHDRVLFDLPFAHLGFMAWIQAFTARRVTIVIGASPWSAGATVDLVRNERITMMTAVPTQYALLLDRTDTAEADFSSLRIAAVGAAAATPELIERLRAGLGCPILNGYAQTEAGVIAGTVVGDDDEVVATTVGRPRPEVELRIVDADGGDVIPGAVGEVACRSPAMMLGYWRDPGLTATVVDADGYLHTGDLGRLREDGNLVLAGRLKEMYIRGGYNVYPSEVEAVLARHPAIARTAVVGVADPVLGEIGVAFVVVAPRVDAGAAPGRDDVRAWCATHLADYKAPDHVVVVTELPVNAVGKVDKTGLAASWARATQDEFARGLGGQA